MGTTWKQITPPIDAAMMLESVSFEVKPIGIIWYLNEQNIVGACAYTTDKNGCGYSGHEFRREGELWYHASKWSQERICVVS